MIIVTGGAGFIGSALVWQLNRQGIDDILVVDELGRDEKWQNLATLRFADYLHKDEFLHALDAGRFHASPRAVVHLGACSITTEQDADFLMRNNYRYTRTLAEWCLARDVRFIYASSAATYGDGAQGYSDRDEITPMLLPLNKYGYSKQVFDLSALRTGALRRMVGLKFFNVFGPNEYHKGDMASVVFKAFHQIRDQGFVRLFKSERADYADGGQMRDFIYVKDVVAVVAWLIDHVEVNGIFNLGAGAARTWKDLVTAVFAAMNLPPRIEFIDLPEALRGRYQYFTRAEMDKLRESDAPVDFPTLEESVQDYVQNYLMQPHPYLSSLP
jgi:ADP-L-glycero-D-manno-heptose 6-epimerase